MLFFTDDPPHRATSPAFVFISAESTKPLITGLPLERLEIDLEHFQAESQYWRIHPCRDRRVIDIRRRFPLFLGGCAPQGMR